MALGDTKTFDYSYAGLTLKIVAIDMGYGKTSFQITCVSGQADINALWWGDGIADGSSPTLTKSDSSLNMNGTGIDWDGVAKLSSTGLGSLGWDKPTALTAGETYDALNLSVDWATISTLGVRATSTSTADGSIKAVDTDGTTQELPTVSIDNVSVSEGEEATFTITLTNTYPYDITVYYGTQNGTAGSGDYTGATGSVTIPAGQTSATVTIATTEESVYELNETFSVDISSATADIPGDDIPVTATDGSGQGTIVNDDPKPSFAINDVTVSEADGTITFTVTKTGATEVASSVDFVVNPGTAGTPGDYSGTTAGTLNFAAGDTTKTITLNVTNDSVYELTQSFNVNLSNAVEATISDAQGVGTITDNDPKPSFAINDVTVSEADGTITFTVTKTGATEVASSVDFAVNPGTAGTDDYSGSTSGTLNFAAGDTTKTITLNVTDDSVYELTESLTVDLTNAVEATISDAKGVGTITDDDPKPSFAINDVTVSEANGTITFTVTKTGATAVASAVDFAVNPGTAGTPGDYSGTTSGTLNFAAGETTKTITLNITNDTVQESTETFTVDLSGAVDATISDGQGVGTINDNDAFIYTPPSPFTGTGDTNDFDDIGDNNSGSSTAGNDQIRGTAAADTISAGTGNDTIYTGAEGDTVTAGPAGGSPPPTDNDTVYAGSGNDTIHGGRGNDTLLGGSGVDTINGNDGNDTITGGFGADLLSGGAGGDTFVYLDAKDTGDTISDFSAGDKIDLAAFAGTLDFVGALSQAGQVDAGEVGFINNGTTTTIYVDTNGVYGADMEITLTGSHTLVGTDFVL